MQEVGHDLPAEGAVGPEELRADVEVDDGRAVGHDGREAAGLHVLPALGILGRPGCAADPTSAAARQRSQCSRRSTTGASSSFPHTTASIWQ